jgi:hypothetical protein
LPLFYWCAAWFDPTYPALVSHDNPAPQGIAFRLSQTPAYDGIERFPAFRQNQFCVHE